MLERLLAHARTLAVAHEVDSQVKAIKDSRTLLDDPDPVSPLLNKVAATLRAELQKKRKLLIEVQEQAIKTLENFQEWQSLAEAKRQHILRQHALHPVSELKISTDEELLATLNATPLTAWEDKIAAPAGRVKKVREETAKLLLPLAIPLSIPQATLKSVEDVDAYLAALRTEIMKHIKAGNAVLI